MRAMVLAFVCIAVIAVAANRVLNDRAILSDMAKVADVKVNLDRTAGPSVRLD